MCGVSALTPTSEELLNHTYLREMASTFDVSPDELKHEIPPGLDLTPANSTLLAGIGNLLAFRKCVSKSNWDLQNLQVLTRRLFRT